ncbi:hypothetical protein EAW52_20320 [Pseudomonas sp. LTJR-52]|nr:hypothetical protein EAW52_20320 [Pseudomonas sp. LTJR-52]
MDAHGKLSPGVNRVQGHKNIADDRYIQSHHFIQNEWAKRNISGYRRNKAPAILIPSASGESHALISSMQRSRRRIEGWGGTIRDEFNVAYREMLEAGIDSSAARKAASRSYKYFYSLGAL